MIYAGRLPAITAACLAGTFAVLWFVVPYLYRERRTPPPPTDG